MIIPLVTGLGSGVSGALIGAHTQRRQYKQQQRDLLWQYEQTLRDEGDYLTYDMYHGGKERYRKPGTKDLHDARNLGYAAIQQLPAELRDDLLKDDYESPEFKTHFDIGDHLGGLANRLRDHLRATKPRSPAIRRTLRNWSEHLHVVGRSSHSKQDHAA